MGYTKLFSDIVCSSIWNEDDKTRIVWITMLAIKGGNHVVRATIGGLAHQARVSIEDCGRAIEKLSNPDPDGLDQPYQGRRIEAVEHGWFILNGEAYRDRRDEEQRKIYQAEWARNKRLKRRLSTSTMSTNGDTVDLSDQIRSDQIENTDVFSLSPEAPKKQSKARPANYEDLRAFVMERLKLTENDALALYEHWEGNGYKNNKAPMANWKATASTWKRRGIFFPSIQSANLGFSKR